jgi:hypothetical protein
MDMVRRAYLAAAKEKPTTLEQLQNNMVMLMVRWIKLRVYSKRDWPSELGEYPKNREAEVKE